MRTNTAKTSDTSQAQSTFLKKKEAVKTIEVKEEQRVETPVVDQFAPIPLGSAIEQ